MAGNFCAKKVKGVGQEIFQIKTWR